MFIDKLAWRLGGLAAWRLGGLAAWRLGGLAAWRLKNICPDRELQVFFRVILAPPTSFPRSVENLLPRVKNPLYPAAVDGITQLC
ncbi:MAG: hypothetical protein LBK76_07125 [Verrucomicrobiales bacterium]|jgi:hypothetical protein|nr:hypothetical protein [Verrucomicrobiales bacterium]